ncbi:S-adenosylmethionine-dependent methyltransferase [Cercophora newfieldiana]|uniref:S-adenosylmethionine-dependent methyltransferase n=1 Tax=Cercophora newfieldiana TaxID=92897 RepID=A0AA40CKK9_9PEZI|nr:S-adenosylmethionine-dependent methyltransferase [Cercophora newfieldiana]
MLGRQPRQHSLKSESTLGSTESLSGSIFDYRKVHGRTFQNFKDAEYWGPNDDKQNNALDLHHHMSLLMHDGKLNLAPIENPQAVLDVGTGTGIWAMDFADQYPSAEVTGTDLSPIQPQWTPPNCKFELDDASLEWTFADNSFDFIHIRYLLGSIEDWPKLYKQAFRCLKPGGWIEHTDSSVNIIDNDNSLPKDNPYPAWNQFFVDAGKKIGKTFNVTENDQQIDWAREAGFDNINLIKHKIPFGTWPAEKKWKEIGVFNQTASVEGLEGYGLLVGTHILGWELTELQVFFAKVRSAMLNTSYHAVNTG